MTKERIDIEICYFGVVTAKKNSKQIVRNPRTGRPMVISNRAAKAQENDMAWQFSIDATEALDKKGIALSDWKYFPHELVVEIWNKDKRRHDLDNQLSSIQDALVLAGVIPDDDPRYIPAVTVRYMGVDKESPRVIIKLKTEVDL